MISARSLQTGAWGHKARRLRSFAVDMPDSYHHPGMARPPLSDMTTVEPVTVPLREEPEGVFRVGDTRVALEVVAHASDSHIVRGLVPRLPTIDLARSFRVEADQEFCRYLDGRPESPGSGVRGVRSRS